MPFYDGKASYSGRFEATKTIHVCKADRFISQIRSSVLESMDAEVRQVELKNTSGAKMAAELLVYFEPQVENALDFSVSSRIFKTVSENRDSSERGHGKAAPEKRGGGAAGDRVLLRRAGLL